MSGIPARYWRKFFKTFTETATAETIDAILDRFAEDVSRTWKSDDQDHDDVTDILRQLVQSLG